MNAIQVVRKSLSTCRLFMLKCSFRKQISTGKRLSVRKGFEINPSTRESRIAIGDNCFFNNWCSINCRDFVSIGDNCMFGESVKIYDHDHVFSSADTEFQNQGFACSPVFIGNNCWIGSNVIILKGVSIGDNCVIGAGAVITKAVEDNTIVVAKQNHIVRTIC